MTIRRASKPANWDALVDAVIREDRDAWRSEVNVYATQVSEAGEGW